jgi:hypothetical protein
VDVTNRATFTAAIDEPRAVDGWFAGGVLTWESGANTGRSIEVKSWRQATGAIELFLPMGHAIEAGRPLPCPSRLRQAPRHLHRPLRKRAQLSR